MNNADTDTGPCESGSAADCSGSSSSVESSPDEPTGPQSAPAATPRESGSLSSVFAAQKIKPARLDPRKAKKLTDRACANILGGWIGAMSSSTLYTSLQVHQALFALVTNDEVWNVIRLQSKQSARATHGGMVDALGCHAEDADPALRALWRSLGGVISGLRVLASERAVRSAVTWWCQREEDWNKMLAEHG